MRTPIKRTAPARKTTAKPGARRSVAIPQLHVVVEAIEKAKGEKAKIAVLEEYASAELKQFLGYIYDPRVTFNTLRELLAYNPVNINDPGVKEIETAAWDLLKKGAGGKSPVYYITDHGRGNFKTEQLQGKVRKMLEGVHPDDAVCLERMFVQEPLNGLTREMLEKAWPKWTKDWPAA